MKNTIKKTVVITLTVVIILIGLKILYKWYDKNYVYQDKTDQIKEHIDSLNADFKAREDSIAMGFQVTFPDTTRK